MQKNSYLYKVLIIHWFIWGFVAMDRLIIGYAMPVLAPQLHLNQAQISWIFASLSITWGVFAFIGGGISDKVGRKKVIIPATFVFTLFSWATGFARSFGALLGVRAIMGAAEGAYLPSATALLAETADDKKRGIIIGLHQSAFPLLGGLIGPLYVAAVMAMTGNVQLVFYLTAIPGIILALVHWKFVKEPEPFKEKKEQPKVKWSEPFRNRNVLLTTLIMILYMSWTILFILFGATYLSSDRGFSIGAANGIMSAWGIGAFLGMISLSYLSDRLGRKKVLIAGTILTALFTLIFFYVPTDFWTLFVVMFLAGGFGQGVYPIFSTIIPVESVAEHLKGTAIGVPLAVGEIIGGGIFPAVIATFAFNFGYGLHAIGVLSGILLIVCAIIAFALKESNPHIQKNLTHAKSIKRAV